MLLAAVLFCTLAIWACGNEETITISDSSSDETVVFDASSSETKGLENAPIEGENEEKPLTEQSDSEEEKVWYVYVTGAVERPGVYEVFPGDRVFDAIEKAGGLKENASETYVNQARFLSDGEMIEILTLEEAQERAKGAEKDFGEAGSGETGSEEAGNVSNGKVDLNQASLNTLMTLPGIGESKAKKIIAWREENGPFKTEKDITKVSGIGESTFQNLKDYIMVSN